MNLLGFLILLSLTVGILLALRRQATKKDQSLLEREIENDFIEEFGITPDSESSKSSEDLLNWMEEEQLREKIESKAKGKER
jgi:hypothetical protein